MRLRKGVKVFLVIVVLIVGIFIYYKVDQKKWKIEVISKEINYRSDHDANSNLIGKVRKGSKFKVLEVYLDDPYFIWYKVKRNMSTGWIASDRYDPYVKEINSPNSEVKEATVVDYNPPVLRFFDDVYYVKDIESINYDHLEVTDDSSYHLSHVVYYEEHPEDTDIPQYWIQYIAEDEAGNKASKIQKIVFENEPAPNKVKNFDEIKNSRR